MVDTALAEYNNPLTVFHLTLRCNLHEVKQKLILEVFLHFRDIYDTSVDQFFKFFIVDIGAVQSHNFIMIVMRHEHEGIIGCGRGEPDIAWHTLIGVYYGVCLDATFLLSGFWMTTDSLENNVRE